MIIKKIIFIILVHLFGFTFIYSQDNNGFNVTIKSIGKGSIAADQIEFNININITDKTDPEVAHKEHKEMIQKLSDLLNSYNIGDDQIRYSLFSIGKTGSRGESEDQYRTEQRVSVILKDMAKHEEFQMDLIKNGISSFRTKFSTSQSEKLKELAITNGLEKAEQKIKIVAKNKNMQTYNIKNINLKERPRIRYSDEVVAFSASGKTIESIPQQVYYIIDIEIEYRLSK